MSRWLLGLSVFVAVSALVTASVSAQVVLLPDNMKELNCEMPTQDTRLIAGSAPGQLYQPKEPVNLTLSIAKGEFSGATDFTLEIQEFGTRTPGKVVAGMEGFSDTVGHAPIIDVIGKPVTHPIRVTFGEAATAQVDVKNLPLPERFGTYALVLVNAKAKSRQLVATLARVPAPRPYGTVENTPIFGEGQFMGGADTLKNRGVIYGRMGIRGWRSELSWNEAEDGTTDWTYFDALFSAAKDSGCQIMVTLGGHGGWKWPFKGYQIPAAVSHNPDWEFNPYWAQADWLCAPELYPRYEKWIAEFCQRYWENGKGGLWGLENFNEPWEGGGISGWARDMIQYREIQRTIARGARAVSPDIRLLAASSIMNTEDKLYPDGTDEFDQYVDIFTDHYVVPSMCYGPMVAKSRGKGSMETETWFVGTEWQLPQGVVQFMAAGQDRISPWHPRALFDMVPGGDERSIIPSPVVTASAAFNYFVTGKSFEKMVFLTHLPWVFQFGKDDDKDALLVMFGQLTNISGSNPKDLPWSQVDVVAGGVMEIDNADGLLKFYDLAGNPVYVGEKVVKLPMNIFPSYITCEKGPKAAAERLAKMKITGKRPVEILPKDFTTRVTAKGAVLTVDVHNCLNREIKGTLAAKAPAEITLAKPEQAVELAAGETKTLTFTISKATALETNAYAFEFYFASDAGRAAYKESLNVAIAPKRTITVDGKLDDWNDVPAVSAVGTVEQLDPIEVLHKPWETLVKEDSRATRGWLKMAWDENYLYLCAQVDDQTPEKSPSFAHRDEDSYFHSKASDDKQPFKRFLETSKVGDKTLKELGISFGDVPYVYARGPEWGIPFRRDRVQIAFNADDKDWHGLKPTTDKVPYGFHTVPDTDYEYSAYPVADGQPELWRQLAPGVPRKHDWPRQPRVKNGPDTGLVEGAKLVITRQGDTYTYEMAIPKSELAKLKFQAGTSFGFVWRVGNSEGATAEYGHDKAVCKQNGLSMHPYWERHPSAGVKWTLTAE